MILRNLTQEPKTVVDAGVKKTVAPAALVKLTDATAMSLLVDQPRSWAAETALIPPPPPSAP